MMNIEYPEYLEFQEGISAKRVPAPESGQTRSGYGKRIPTGYMVTHEGREYRVYCTIFSNVGTLFIEVKGVQKLVKIW